MISGSLISLLKSSGVGIEIILPRSILNGVSKMRCSRRSYAIGSMQVHPEPPFSFHATARLSPALPSSTVGLSHSSRLPSGDLSFRISRVSSPCGQSSRTTSNAAASRTLKSSRLFASISGNFPAQKTHVSPMRVRTRRTEP